MKTDNNKTHKEQFEIQHFWASAVQVRGPGTWYYVALLPFVTKIQKQSQLLHLLHVKH